MKPQSDLTGLAVDDVTFEPVTATQVKAAALAKGLTRVPLHDCSMCGYMCSYIIDGERLYYDSGCYCTSRQTISPRDWQDAADGINMQSQPKWREHYRKMWGLPVEDAAALSHAAQG